MLPAKSVQILTRSLFLAFLFPAMLTTANAATRAPIHSKETVEFRARAEDEVFFLGKVAEFVGAYHRSEEGDLALKNADLYAFPKISEIKMDLKICDQILQKIFGPKSEITLKIESPQLYAGHTGKTCQASVIDPTPSPKIFERRVVAGFLGAKAYAIVFRFPVKTTEAQHEGVRKFWASLR